MHDTAVLGDQKGRNKVFKTGDGQEKFRMTEVNSMDVRAAIWSIKHRKQESNQSVVRSLQSFLKISHLLYQLKGILAIATGSIKLFIKLSAKRSTITAFNFKC